MTSHHDHLALLEAHNHHLEGTVSKNTEDVKKLMSLVEHLSRRVESLANQLRIMTFNGTGQGSEVSSASGSPSISAEHRSSPISVDNRPPAPLPGEGRQGGEGREGIIVLSLYIGPTAGVDGCHRKPVVGTYDGTYHLIGGTMEGISPPEPRSIYSSAKDDESAMSNEEYLTTLSHFQVRESAMTIYMWTMS